MQSELTPATDSLDSPASGSSSATFGENPFAAPAEAAPMMSGGLDFSSAFDQPLDLPVFAPEPEPVAEVPAAAALMTPPPLVFLARPEAKEQIQAAIGGPPDPARLPWDPLPTVDESYLASSALRHQEILRQVRSGAVGAGSFLERVQPAADAAEPASDLGGLLIPELPSAAEVPAASPADTVALEAEPAEVSGQPTAAMLVEQESSAEHAARAEAIRQQTQDADVTTAISHYRRAIEDSPDNLVLRTDLADIHMRYGLLDDAVVQYRQIIMRKPQSVSLRHKLIQAHLWNDNYEEAAATLLELADLHAEHQHFGDALDALQSILSLDPHNFEARRKLVDRFAASNQGNLAAHHLRQLAEGALSKGNVEEAIGAFKQLMQISDDPSLEDRLAQVYESQGSRDEALEILRRLAERYREAQRWEEAANVTERIILLDPENLAMRRALIEHYAGMGLHDRVVAQKFELGQHLHSTGNLPGAIELYESVVRTRADYHEARRMLVDAYLDSDQVEQAASHTEALTERYQEVGEYATAVELFLRLVEKLPERIDLRQRLIHFYGLAQDSQNALGQWLAVADLHEQVGRVQETLASVRKALELDETRDDLHYRLAQLYLDPVGDTGAALAEFQRVHELNPGHLDAMERFANLLLGMGRARDAAEVILKLEKANKAGSRVRTAILDRYRERIEAEPTDLKTRFTYGEVCYNLQALDLAIEQFQHTRRDSGYELQSYNMLGLCFAEKTGFNMLDLAIKQFRKGLETKGHSEQEYLELRYNLAMLQYRNNRLQEALQELKDCYAVDIAFKDVREWIRRIESEIAGGPKVRK